MLPLPAAAAAAATAATGSESTGSSSQGLPLPQAAPHAAPQTCLHQPLVLTVPSGPSPPPRAPVGSTALPGAWVPLSGAPALSSELPQPPSLLAPPAQGAALLPAVAVSVYLIVPL